MFETFDHTADIGLRVHAATENDLFAEAGRGLFSLVVENLDDVQPAQHLAFDIAGHDREYLLFDWLNELLFRFETEKWLFVEFDAHVGPDGLHATARGEPFDAARHRLSHEVKAVTYHHLKFEQTPDGWLAEVIFDI